MLGLGLKSSCQVRCKSALNQGGDLLDLSLNTVTDFPVYVQENGDDFSQRWEVCCHINGVRYSTHNRNCNVIANRPNIIRILK